MVVPSLRGGAGIFLCVLLGCQPGGAPVPVPGDAGLPPIPHLTGPLRIAVAYPAPTDVVDVRDSTFLFGSVGTGDATLTVNGDTVPVAPNGAWLAWVPVPPDTLIRFTLVARTATDSASLVYPVHRVHRFIAPDATVWVDSTSFVPADQVWWPADEYLPLRVRAAPDADVRLVLPDGGTVQLVPESAAAEIPWGIRAFDRDTGNLAAAPRADRYVGLLRGRSLGRDPGPLLGPAPTDSGLGSGPALPAVVEVIRGSDTARATWSLRIALLDSLPRIVRLDDDTAGEGTGDSLTVGRARPGATYHWFFPTGTRTVATGRIGADLRLQLSRGQEVWIAAQDAHPLPRGTPALRATAGSITATPESDRVVLRIPLSARVPFRVEESGHRLTLRLYGTVSDINWTRYGRDDPYLRRVRWIQDGTDEVAITVELGGPVWGYRARWNRNDLLFEIRRPPPIDPGHPLAGRLIVVDPGHPPLGATGPTGLREAEANLAVALRLRELLRTAGARVLLTRDRDTAVSLQARVRFADSVNAEVLVSIHNNALPDGVNPFTNNGASVFYNHLQSLPLARDIQRALVQRLAVPDLGVGRGDLALARPTWMPAVLCEGLYLMLPRQESALRQPAGQRRYALAVRDGLERYLRDVASGRGPDVP